MNAMYPARERFYSHKFTRLLFKSCAAMEMGQDAVLLCIHIAHTEDAAKYSGPVRFWNSQLNETLGFKSPKSLNTARNRAVEAGWLHYERRHNRADGNYWTLIPNRVAKFNDEPIEEIEYSGIIPSTERLDGNHSKYGTDSGTNPGTNSGMNKCSIPVPVPVPIPRERGARASVAAVVSSKPTLEQVREYVRDQAYGVDADAIFDHYEANGWIQGRGKPIRCWKAAVRQWARREKDFAKPPTSSRTAGKPSIDYPDFTGKGHQKGKRA